MAVPGAGLSGGRSGGQGVSEVSWDESKPETDVQACSWKPPRKPSRRRTHLWPQQGPCYSSSLLQGVTARGARRISKSAKEPQSPPGSLPATWSAPSHPPVSLDGWTPWEPTGSLLRKPVGPTEKRPQSISYLKNISPDKHISVYFYRKKSSINLTFKRKSVPYSRES